MAGALVHLLQSLVFLLFAAAPLPFCFVVARRWGNESGNAGVPQALLVVFLVWSVAQALAAHLLGILHLLHFPAMFALESAIFVGGLFAWRRSGPSSSSKLRLPRLSSVERVVLVAIAAMGATLLWWVAAIPIVDSDSWAFHLPTMVGWLQSGTFTRMGQYTDRPRNSYPYGWEAICALFLTPFDEDLLVAFPNLLAWMMLGAGTYALARAFSAQRSHALACAAMLLAMRVIVVPIDSMHVDVSFAALFAAGCFFAVEWARRGGDVALGLAAAAVGFSGGVRTTAPFYAAALLVWLPLARAWQPTRPAKLGGGHRFTASGIVAGAFLGGFWWIKNTVELGHPLGSGAPLTGDAHPFRTWEHYTGTSLASSVALFEWASWRSLYERAAYELGLPFGALAAIAALLPFAWWRGSLRRTDIAPVALAAGCLVLFWITPLSAISGIQTRLGFPFAVALAVCAAVVATRLRLRPEMTGLLAVLSTLPSFSYSRVFYPFAALATLVAMWPRRLPVRRHALALAALGLALWIAGTAAARSRREREKLVLYDPVYAHLDQHVSATEPIAYFGGGRSYFLSGRHLRRPLIYAPFEGEESPRDWNGRLRRQGISLVAVGPWPGDPETGEVATELVAVGAMEMIIGGGIPDRITLYRLRSMDSSGAIH